MGRRLARLATVWGRSVATGTIAAATLGACSSTKTGTGPTSPTSKVVLWVASGATLSGYTTSQLASGTSGAPKVVVTTPLMTEAITFDRNGNLWAGEGQHVIEFTPTQLAASGSPTPAVTLATNDTSLIDATALAFDASGSLWVGNNNATYSTIVEFTTNQLASSGSPVPAVTLTSSLAPPYTPAIGPIFGPSGMTFDHSGNLWVVNGATTLPPYTTQPPSRIPAIHRRARRRRRGYAGHR